MRKKNVISSNFNVQNESLPYYLHSEGKNRLNKHTGEGKLQVNIRILKMNGCSLNSYIFSYMYITGIMFLSKFLKLSGKLSCDTSTLYQGGC